MAKLLWKSKKNKRQKSIVVAVSGGFDPIHVGHVRLFQEAGSRPRLPESIQLQKIAFLVIF